MYRKRQAQTNAHRSSIGATATRGTPWPTRPMMNLPLYSRLEKTGANPQPTRPRINPSSYSRVENAHIAMQSLHMVTSKSYISVEGACPYHTAASTARKVIGRSTSRSVIWEFAGLQSPLRRQRWLQELRATTISRLVMIVKLKKTNALEQSVQPYHEYEQYLI